MFSLIPEELSWSTVPQSMATIQNTFSNEYGALIGKLF